MSRSALFISNHMTGSNAGENGAPSPVHTQQEKMAAKMVEHILASGLGSRGGPNKMSNKMRRCPRSYHHV